MGLDQNQIRNQNVMSPQRIGHDVRIAKHYSKRTEMRHNASNDETIAGQEIACKSQMFTRHRIRRPRQNLEFCFRKKKIGGKCKTNANKRTKKY